VVEVGDDAALEQQHRDEERDGHDHTGAHHRAADGEPTNLASPELVRGPRTGLGGASQGQRLPRRASSSPVSDLAQAKGPSGSMSTANVVVGVVTPPQLMPVVASCRRCSHERHSTSSPTAVRPLTRGKSHQRAAHTRLRPLIGRWQTAAQVVPHELVDRSEYIVGSPGSSGGPPGSVSDSSGLISPARLRVGAWSTGNVAKDRLGEAAIDTDVLPGDITR
jgi:hypothetical protein